MTSKEKSAQLIDRHAHKLRCPICHGSLQVIELRKVVCENNHSFDLAKQGYVNFLNRPVTSQYNRELFLSRQKIITESYLYQSLHAEIVDILKRRMAELDIILDAGCGEGSHLQQIVNELDGPVTGVGLDISKEGIKLAAGSYKSAIWFVGDLANLPMADQSNDVILNILSPANYEEFKRVLKPDGIIMKVVPRDHYLRELRQAVGKENETSDSTVKLFKQHFDLVDHIELNEKIKLDQTQLNDLVKMAPLAWNASPEQVHRFTSQETADITVDLDLLVGRIKLPPRG